MTRWTEQLSQNNNLPKQEKDLFSLWDVDKIIENFYKNYFDEDNLLTKEWFNILNNLRFIWNNEQIYQNISSEFKANIALNLEEFRKTPQDQENAKQLNLINKWIEAEYSYIDQNKFWNKEEIKTNNEFNPNNLNTFAKMKLVDLYELCEWTPERKQEFVLAIMKNQKELYKDDYLRIVLNNI